MNRTLFICVVFAVAQSLTASDKCQAISDIVGQAAVGKPAIVAELKKNPQKGTLGEPWRYLWFTSKDELSRLGVSDKQQEEIFRTIGTLNFSTNAEVNFDIFREYFYLECNRKERGESSVPLKAIPPASLTGCWNSVGSRPQFQACVEKLMTPSSRDKR